RLYLINAASSTRRRDSELTDVSPGLRRMSGGLFAIGRSHVSADALLHDCHLQLTAEPASGCLKTPRPRGHRTLGRNETPCRRSRPRGRRERRSERLWSRSRCPRSVTLRARTKEGSTRTCGRRKFITWALCGAELVVVEVLRGEVR